MDGVGIRERSAVSRVADHLGDRAVLDHVVQQLLEIERSSGLERTLAIGRVILTQFFGDDPTIWQDRRRNKNNSIRRLADRADCPLSKSALNDAVAVYVASRQLKCVRATGHITASHISVVLSLPPPEREQMLEKAEQRSWSVKQLKAEVISVRRASGERRGRPPRDVTDRALSLVREAVERLRQALSTLPFAALSSAARGELASLTSDALALATDLRSIVEQERSASMRLRTAPSVPAEERRVARKGA
jgi:hypothetical protein